MEWSSDGREEMGCRSASLVVRCDIVGPIAAKQRKKERKHRNGYSVSIYCVSTRSSSTLEHSRALRLQGRRLLVPMCRSVGEAGDWGGGWDFAGDLFRRKKGCQGCVNSISACWEISADLVGRSVMISLVPSVAEADVATVDGLESTIKSARDRKR
ncbi:hypothetical protein GW17_00053963 [Ensete ventricosum]|nr:hypothetical protein GW17_00053963 [Ensete ventricosum]